MQVANATRKAANINPTLIMTKLAARIKGGATSSCNPTFLMLDNAANAEASERRTGIPPVSWIYRLSSEFKGSHGGITPH